MKNALSPSEFASIHLRIAVIYKAIELNDEAIDEAETALRYNPSNTEALFVIESALKKRAKPQALVNIYREILAIDSTNRIARMRLDSLQQTVPK